MLCSQDTGKYLTGKWHEDRDLAVQETGNFTSDDLTFLEMDGTQDGPVGKLDQYDRTMRMKTIPVGYYDEADEYDYRCNPEVG